MADPPEDLELEPLPRQTGPPAYTAAQRRRLYSAAAQARLRAADPLSAAVLDALTPPPPAPASAGAVLPLSPPPRRSR